jgi:photosystem II stability/assembly factor-like uncharacterized protein
MLNLIVGLLFVAIQSPGPGWVQQTINTNADFRGICAISPQVAWVSGTRGTVGRTIDGGKTWQLLNVPNAEKLDFRDVEAFSENTAYVLSIGPGDNSRIYKTSDGGKTWSMQFQNSNVEAFFDAIAFWDEGHGIALSDPVKGQFHLVTTEDGGAHWHALPPSAALTALPAEGAFAASGTCLITQGKSDVWFVTGGAKVARVFHSADHGKNWIVSETPILAGKNSAGIFSIAFRDETNGMVVGGDYRQPNESGTTTALTTDGGKTWKPITNQLPFCSAVAWTGTSWIAVGTSGSHQSHDGGVTWKRLDDENYNCVSFSKQGIGWAAGPKGRIAKLHQ